MRPFTKQVFLNEADADDSGAVSFSVSRSKRDRYSRSKTMIQGISSKATFWDCSRKIVLDFYVNGAYISEENGISKEDKAEALFDIRARRKKVARLRNAVTAFCDAMDEALDEMQSEIDSL